MMTFRAAAQDHRIAGLERKRAGVRRDIGTALVDHADDTERNAHALDRHAVRPAPGFGDFADGIGQGADDIEPVGHRGNALVVKREPVKEGGGRASGLGRCQVLAIGGDDVGLVRANGRSHGGERLILLRRRGERQRARRGPRPAADLAHGRGDVGGPLDGFERRGHGDRSRDICSKH